MNNDKRVIEKAKELYYAYSKHTSIFCKWELRNIGYQTAWKWLAKHVLAGEIRARIEEVEEWGEGSFSSGERVKELQAQLKHLES